MTDRILAITLHSDLLTAVLLDDDKNQAIVTSSVLQTEGRSPEELIDELAAGMDCSDCRCFFALGASFFSFRNLTLPFSDRKSIDKILPFELEEHIAKPISTMLIDAMVNSGGGETTEIIAAMIERRVLAEWLAALQNTGLFPEVITISSLHTLYRIQENGQPPEEFIFLDLRLKNATLFLISSGRLQLVRSLVFDAGQKAGFTFDKEKAEIHVQRPEHGADSFRKLALAVRQTLTSLSLTSPLETLPIYVDGSTCLAQSATSWLEEAFHLPCLVCGRAGSLPLPSSLPAATEAHASFLTPCLSLGTMGGKSKTDFNFCKEEFAHSKNRIDYLSLGRLIGLPLLAILLLALGYLWYETSVLKKQQAALVTEIHQVFRETLPAVSRIVDPRQQLQVAVNAARISSTDDEGSTLPHTVLHVLREISTRIPASMDVQLTRLIYETKGLRLIGITDTFNTVDSMKKNLAQSPDFTGVTISSANMNAKNGKVRFELKIDLRKSTP